MSIMLHQDWMKGTAAGMFVRRSPELVAVDNALKTYHQQSSVKALDTLQGALLRWMQMKGSDWKTSVRNKHNAVDTLYKQVTGLGTQKSQSKQVTGLGTQQPHSLVALSHVRDESRAILTDLFQGKQMVFRPGLVTKLAGNGTFGKLGAYATLRSVAKSSNTVSGGALASGIKSLPSQVLKAGGSGASNDSQAGSLATQLMREFVPSDLASDVTQAMASAMPDFLIQLKASCVPIAGILVSGGSLIASGLQVLRSEYRLSQAEMHAQRSLSADEPEAAFLALVRMLEREANNNLAGFAKGLAEFGGKIASALADGGTATNAAIGLASGLIKLLMLLRIVVRDVQERNAANMLLSQPVITVKLFETCPVMGAYLICCAPTSVIVNTILSSDKFYEPGMMDTVERAVMRHVQPLREQAQRLVNEHRMYIVELQSYPGVLEKNKKALKAMLDAKGKSDIAQMGFGSDDFDNLLVTRPRR
jgi:hypothetical protein